MAKKYFGTDGIRGKVGEAPITPDFIMKLGWAAGKVLAKNGDGPVLIGKDTRISGYMFESALEAGLSAAGVDICLLGPMPTPGIAYLTRNARAQAGIVISASHNSFHDNGIKFFSSEGTKLPDHIEMEIEETLEEPMKVSDPEKLGKARRIVDASRRYIEFCKFRVKNNLDLKGLRVVVDCAHGATYHIAPYVFEELGADVITIGNKPDGFNINVEHGATKPGLLQKKVIECEADVGIALDGDGDRLIMVDHKGEVVDGDEILFVIAQGRQKILGDGIVGTVMSNLGLEIAIKNLNLNFYRAQVGDRYVMEMLHKNNLKLGGESSGHIINLDMTTTGDGIISALQVLDIMVDSDKNLFDLKSGMEKYPQMMINVKIDKDVDLSKMTNVQDAVRTAESELGDKGRILLRPSGTEPLVRVMVEGE
ncbi:MAG: phosphoglucosamine mutase, partial [Gammaproteobacteria bacterium]|nr:phosphoglucosamine mutase [Gammaproteobacteria bacterium]